jgi:chorismate mutase
VPEREEEVLRNVLAANEGPLSNEAVRRLFERVIDETRALERQKYQDLPPEAE